MKTTLFSIFLILFIVSTGYLPNTYAQDYTQWKLPEGAIARLGKGSVRDIAFYPDGTRFAVASSIGIWLYNADTYQEAALLTGHTENFEVGALSVSSDGRTLAAASGNTIRLWDTATSELKKILTTDSREGISSLVFSSDGQTLASASWDEIIRLWDPVTGELRKTLRGHTDPNPNFAIGPSVVFRFDDQTLVSGGEDGTIRLWDPVTGELRKTLRGHTDKVTSSLSTLSLKVNLLTFR